MARIFNVRRPCGTLCAQSTTRIHAQREIRWQIASGFPGPFDIEPTERDRNTRWGFGAPQRSGFPWSGAKHLEFLKRYARGDYIRDLRDYFDTSEFTICRKAREFGFNRRIDDPRTFEQYRGRWTDREEELINFMYDEETTIGRIGETIPRTESAITSRLRKSAPELSTRSAQGRFIVDGRRKRGIVPVLE